MGNYLKMIDVQRWSPIISSTSIDLYDVWSTSRGDVFSVGKAGTILHYHSH